MQKRTLCAAVAGLMLLLSPVAARGEESVTQQPAPIVEGADEDRQVTDGESMPDEGSGDLTPDEGAMAQDGDDVVVTDQTGLNGSAETPADDSEGASQAGDDELPSEMPGESGDAVTPEQGQDGGDDLVTPEQGQQATEEEGQEADEPTATEGEEPAQPTDSQETPSADEAVTEAETAPAVQEAPAELVTEPVQNATTTPAASTHVLACACEKAPAAVEIAEAKSKSKAATTPKATTAAKAGASTATAKAATTAKKVTTDATQSQPKKASTSKTALQKGGVYTVAPSTNTALRVSVASNSVAAGANVLAGKALSLLGEYWRVVANGDGTYSFVNLRGTKGLGISGTIKSGANVTTVAGNGIHWRLKTFSDGSLALIPNGHGTLRLEVVGSTAKSGANILVRTANSKALQRFFFTLSESLTAAAKAGKAVTTGTASISSAAKSNMVLDVAGASKAAGANIRIWGSNDSTAQKYVLAYAGNGLYTIQAGNSGKYLEVQGDSDKSGANVQQNSRTGKLGQYWYFVKDGNGYAIRNAKSGMTLDLANGKTDKGTNVRVWRPNGTAAQRFEIKRTPLINSGTVVSLVPSHATSALVVVKGDSSAAGTNVQLGKDSAVLGQYWRVVLDKNGSYHFYNIHGNKALAINGKVATKANVVTAAGAGTPWRLFLTDNGTFSLRAQANTSLALDVASAGTSAGTNVRLLKSSGSAAQQFLLVDNIPLTTAVKSGKIVTTGVSTISNAAASKKVLDIAKGSRDDGANVRIWNSNKSLAQKYGLEYVGNGLYTIQAGNSGKYLEAKGTSHKAGANVQQNSRTGKLNQYWYFVAQKDGYVIRNARTGLALDLANGKTDNGTNVRVWNANGSDAQRFKVSDAQLVSNGTYVLSSELATPLVLDVKGSTKAGKGNIEINRSTGSKAEQFVITYLGKGLYTIKNRNSGRYLEVAGSSNAKGANIRQGTASATSAQKWRIGISEFGGITLQSASTGKFLDVAGGTKKFGTNVQQWNKNNSASQSFNLKDGSWDFGSEVVRIARTQLGTSYSYVSSGYFPYDSFNCSGLTWWVYHMAGYDVSHNQGYHSYYMGEENIEDSTMWQTERAGNWTVNTSELYPGDLVYFSPIWSKWHTGHVGIYIGNDLMIHSWPTTGTAVCSVYGLPKDHFVGGGLPL